MSALSKTAVINAALSLAELGRISSPGDDDPRAREAAKHYDHVRQGLLEVHPWNFALARSSLAAHGTSPAWGWNTAFVLPTDTLKVWAVNGADRHCRWGVERHQGLRCIVTDLTAPLEIAYAADVTATGQWAPLFTQAMIGQLAMLIAAKLGDRGDVARARDFYVGALAAARRADSQEGIPEQPGDPDWITSRWTGPQLNGWVGDGTSN